MPTHEVAQDDVSLLLRFVSDAHARTQPAERLQVMLADLPRLVPCDELSFMTYDTERRRVWQQSPDEPADPGAEVFWAYYWDDLSCSYPDRTGDRRSVTKATDFYTPGQLAKLPMYTEYLAADRLLYEIMLCLPAGSGLVQRLVMFRAGPDFTERERGLLALLRPHFYEAFREAGLAATAAPQVTSRQAELLRLVADGWTNRQIARRLGVSEATVRKHLENAFQRLGVTSRTAAVTRLFADQMAG